MYISWDKRYLEHKSRENVISVIYVSRRQVVMRETCHLKYDASLASPVPFFRSSLSALSLRNLIPTSCHATVAVLSLCQDVARRGGQLGEFPRESRAKLRVNSTVTSPLRSRFHETTSSWSLALLLNTLLLSLSLPRFQFFRFSKTSLLSLHASLQESARDPFLFFFLFFSRHTRVATVLPCQSWKFRGGGNERRVYRRAITGNKSGKIEWRDTIGYIAKKRRPINNRW